MEHKKREQDSDKYLRCRRAPSIISSKSSNEREPVPASKTGIVLPEASGFDAAEAELFALSIKSWWVGLRNASPLTEILHLLRDWLNAESLPGRSRG